MADLLRAWGHTVEVAPDGDAGSELALRLRPDVAFVDIALPRLDGYAVASYLREQKHQSLLERSDACGRVKLRAGLHG